VKKLLLLLLLTTSFSTFGLSLVEKERCFPSFIQEAEIKLESADSELAADLARDELLRAIESLSIEQKVFYETDGINWLGEDCKQSPEGSLINGVREGKWTWYDNFNWKIKQGNYVNGLKEGQWTEWLYSGHAYDTIEMNYKNDKLDGKWVHWYSYDPYAAWGNEQRSMKWSLEMQHLKDELKIQEVDLAIETAIYQARRLQEQMIKDRQTQEAVEYEIAAFETELAKQKALDEAKQKAKLEEQIKHKEKLLFNLEFPRILAEGNYINGKKDGTWTYWYREGPFQKEKDGGWYYWNSWHFWNSAGQIQKEEVYEDGVLIY
jgi:antitoxin component YwqK of YwqJK toxin-antitoxin module